MPVCESVASRIMCLPLYHTLTSSDLDLITRIILRVQNYGQPEPSEKMNVPIEALHPALTIAQNGAAL
jgi:hypothetical protein